MLRTADNSDAINQELAKRRLNHFIRQMWPVLDANEFCPGWHIDVISDHLQKVTRGEIRRLIINIPPRHMKTLQAGVGWPAWTWVQDSGQYPNAGPHVKFMYLSYINELALESSINCRRLIESDWYQGNWGDKFKMRADQNAKGKFENSEGGYRMSTSIYGGSTGKGADIIVIDDPHNTHEVESVKKREDVIRWWKETLTTRLNNPHTGAYVLIMQRVHHDDLTGYLLNNEGDRWTHLCLPATYDSQHPHLCDADKRHRDGELLWPERYTDEIVKNMIDSLGPYAAAGQYQQMPSPRKGGMFEREWFEVVQSVPGRGRTVRAWDLAASEGNQRYAAYTVGLKITCVNRIFYIQDVVRSQGSSHHVRELMKRTAIRDGLDVIVDIPQDPGQAGKTQVADLTSLLVGYNVRSSPETGNKELRADAVSAQAEAGNVKLVNGSWNEAFLEEVCAFPNSNYMDQVDALSRGFNNLVRYLNSGTSTVAPQLIKIAS